MLRSIPFDASLIPCQVEHGCSVVSIGGSRGVLVVGGATGDDLVEFLDWEVKKEWRVLGRLNNGRGNKQTKIYCRSNINISQILFYKA